MGVSRIYFEVCDDHQLIQFCISSKKLSKGSRRFWTDEGEENAGLPRHAKDKEEGSFDEKHSSKETPPVLVHEDSPEHEVPTKTHSPV